MTTEQEIRERIAKLLGEFPDGKVMYSDVTDVLGYQQGKVRKGIHGHMRKYHHDPREIGAVFKDYPRMQLLPAMEALAKLFSPRSTSPSRFSRRSRGPTCWQRETQSLELSPGKQRS